MRLLLVGAVSALLPIAAWASDTFVNGQDGAKAHSSGFVCPQKIGDFERDAVGESDPENASDFCTYSAVGGVYGTVKLMPLSGPYDAKSALAPDFAVQEATGGKRISENLLKFGAVPLTIYARTYSTARAEALQYRIIFAGAAIKGWAVETTVEYADPRDSQTEAEFLHAVYAAAAKQIGK